MASQYPPRSAMPRFDANGFLTEPELWDEQLAERIARSDGLAPLTPAHWKIIHCLREHYRQHGAMPLPLHHVCHLNDMDRHCMEQLFPSEREAWRIAGLPDPGEEARTYMM